jgi:peptidoglycan-associated lipoprotein
MNKVFLVVVLVLGVVMIVGCHPKKMRPLGPSGQEGTKPPAETVVKEPAERPIEKPIKPIETTEGEGMALKDINFEYDKYNLTEAAGDVLAGNAEYLMKHPDVDAFVEGHCDERGTEEYNLALGEKRAIAARDFLVRFGIDRSRISIISYGEERPLDPSGTEGAWAKNRRDHFVVK